MLLTRSFLTAVACAVATAAGAQTLSFSRADFAASAAPRGIVAADFNRDGAMDLAMVNTGRDSLSILINHASRGQGFVQAYDIVLGGGPFDVAAADLNTDNVVDIVVANADLNTIDIILGKAAGGFEAPVHIAASGNPRGVAVADLDRDGRPDIVYTQFYLNSVQILHGDGAGNFTARVAALPTGASPQGVAIGNFDVCCRPDIIVANTAANALSLFRQVDGDKFDRTDVPGVSPTNVLTAGDFNRDGRLDLAAASSTTNKVSLFRDFGTGTGFGFYGTFAAGSSPRGIEAADLNKDGHLDLVTANRGGNNVSIFTGRPDSSGSFNTPFTVAAGAGSRDVVLADFNADGQIDIATANEFGNSATVLTNTFQPPSGLFWEARALKPTSTYNGFVTLADFNRNGMVDIVRGDGVLLDGTTSVPLSRGGTTPRSAMNAAVGDFNGDGNTDVAVVTLYNDGTYPQPITTELYYGNGTGGFQHAGSFGSFRWVYDMDAADLNNDGRPDLAIVDINDGSPGGKVHVLFAGGSGFVQQPVVNLATIALGLDLADVNRDGKTDLLIAHWYDGSGVQVYTGDGTGAFSRGQFLDTAEALWDVHAIDINRDGVLDILSGGSGPLTVWLGSSSGTFGDPQTYARDTLSIVVADLTADGHLDVLTARGQFVRGRGDGTFGEPEPVNITFDDAEPADYDRDGRMDVVLVNYWHTMVLFSRATRGENFPPVAIAGPDYTVSYERQFDDNECESPGPSYDPNLDTLTYEWLDQNGRIVSTAGIFCSPVLSPGTHTFTLVVRDGHGGEASDSKTITVTPFKESVVPVGYAYGQGAWRTVNDSTAAQEVRMWHPNAGAPKAPTALAAPTHFFEAPFLADPTQTYKIWVRLRAENDSWSNDSVFIQFGEGAVAANGATRYRIGTTDAIDINLEQCSGCGVSGWGWRDERWGSTLNAAPVLLRFPQGGWQTLRVQTREDGVSIDQVVFSSEKYLNAPPGPPKNDNTVLQPRPW